MGIQNFAGSGGLTDVPVPAWVESDHLLFACWGRCLIQLIKHGKIKTLKRGEQLELNDFRVAMVVDGGVYAIGKAPHDPNRRILMHFYKRGELVLSGADNDPIELLEAHCRSTCLTLNQAQFDAFAGDFELAERLCSELRSEQASHLYQAIQSYAGRDIDRIKTTLQLLASHPTSITTKVGREIEASKGQIRDLAGVQKRSATRAFKMLEDQGVVAFSGYKRLFFSGDQCG